MADFRVVHERDDTLGESDASNRSLLATNVTIADTLLSAARGLMFRSTIPDNFALVMEVGGNSAFPFTSGPPRQFVHMLFVRMSLDVIWLDDDEVVKVKRMKPWRSLGVAQADRILELPVGSADDVSVGDTVLVETRDGDRVEPQ